MFSHQKFPKSSFSSNCSYNTGYFIDFSPKKVIFPQNATAYRALLLFCLIISQCFFTPKITKNFILPQIVTIIQGTLLTFLPKKWVFPQNAHAYQAIFWLFCLIIKCDFTPKIPRKLIFPQNAHAYTLKTQYNLTFSDLFSLFWFKNTIVNPYCWYKYEFFKITIVNPN